MFFQKKKKKEARECSDVLNRTTDVQTSHPYWQDLIAHGLVNSKTSSVKAEQGMRLGSQIWVLTEEHSLSKEVAKEAASQWPNGWGEAPLWNGWDESVNQSLKVRWALIEHADQF